MSNYPYDPADADDSLEEEITRGTVYDRNYAADRNHAADRDYAADRTEEPSEAPQPTGVRVGSLVWGVIALLVALWSLSVTVFDWNIDTVLVLIGLAVVGGLALLISGIAGAAQRKNS
ncbi:hypothetical protein [Citricoccus sp. GCM10030269]|uniref:hypothetical protein n=1 Tax=Citricoccus sp. GCM10030269 TaxID=3273388 RepID=UPI00360BEB04